MNASNNQQAYSYLQVRNKYYQAVFSGCLLIDDKGKLETNISEISGDAKLAPVFKKDAEMLLVDLDRLVKSESTLGNCAKEWGDRIHRALRIEGKGSTRDQWERWDREGLTKGLVKSYVMGLMDFLIQNLPSSAPPEKARALGKISAVLSDYYDKNYIFNSNEKAHKTKLPIR